MTKLTGGLALTVSGSKTNVQTWAPVVPLPPGCVEQMSAGKALNPIPKCE